MREGRNWKRKGNGRGGRTEGMNERRKRGEGNRGGKEGRRWGRKGGGRERAGEGVRKGKKRERVKERRK